MICSLKEEMDMKKAKVNVGDQIKMVETPFHTTQARIAYGFRIGECYTVTEVTDESITARNGSAVVCMSHDDMSRYFVIHKKYEPVEKKVLTKPKKKTKAGKWSEWTTIKISGNQYAYKTNGKKVVIRGGGFKGESSCHDEDDFDLATGLKMAYQRLITNQIAGDFDFIGWEC